MSESGASAIPAWYRRLTALPTKFHLWCAEQELRSANAGGLSGPLQRARMRNLDLLREYRQRGEFPENSHAPSKLAPCFIDSHGRQCAVAFLMDKSGALSAAQAIVKSANYARIAEMRSEDLEAWVTESGLTSSELARIQPAYPPTYEQATEYVEIILTTWFVGALAANSMVFNMCRLIGGFRARVTTVGLGIVLGATLLVVALRMNLDQFLYTPRLLYELQNARLCALAIGATAVVCGIIPLCVRREVPHPRGAASATITALRSIVLLLSFPVCILTGVLGAVAGICAVLHEPLSGPSLEYLIRWGAGGGVLGAGATAMAVSRVQQGRLWWALLLGGVITLVVSCASMWCAVVSA